MFEIENFNGRTVIITNQITKDIQARTHRNKRINKKWLKRYGHKSVPDNTKIIVTADRLFMTSKCFEKLKKMMGKDEFMEETLECKINKLIPQIEQYASEIGVDRIYSGSYMDLMNSEAFLYPMIIFRNGLKQRITVDGNFIKDNDFKVVLEKIEGKIRECVKQMEVN